MTLFMMQFTCVWVCYAQSPDTVALTNVDVLAQKKQVTTTGKRSEILDSLSMVPYASQAMSELIASGTGIFVKSYGPGAIASSALRGGNASQTAFVWNGFNLQNTMLGQTDMSLLPVALFDEVQIDYGASAASWGSGAVGGAIHLKDNNGLTKGFSAAATLGGGSFGRRFFSGRYTIGNKRINSVTRFYGNASENDFPYKDSTDPLHPEKTMARAGYGMLGIMQQLKILIGQRGILNLNGWFNFADRQIPSVIKTTPSNTRQEDKALRLTADYKFEKRRFTSITKAAFFDEKLNYEDSVAMLFTHNKVKTVMFENENYLRWNRTNESAIFLVTNHSLGNTEYYNEAHRYSRSGIVLTHGFKLLQQKLRVLAMARVEYYSGGALPVTWNIGLTYKLTEQISLLANGGSFYRQPTLNELYWVPGGNPQLKPESGYSTEGSMEYHKEIGKLEFKFAGTLYWRQTENWILWVPGPGASPEARNVQLVLSRGSDSKSSLYFKKNKFLAGLVANTSYVLSTVNENTLPNDASLNRQLIYTPRYIVTGSLHLSYQRISLFSSYQYCGYRFTSSDNAQWLTPYSTWSVRVTYVQPLKSSAIDFFAAVYNLADRDYAVIAGRPMPGRNFEIGITLKAFNQNNKP